MIVLAHMIHGTTDAAYHSPYRRIQHTRHQNLHQDLLLCHRGVQNEHVAETTARPGDRMSSALAVNVTHDVYGGARISREYQLADMLICTWLPLSLAPMARGSGGHEEVRGVVGSGAHEGSG